MAKKTLKTYEVFRLSDHVLLGTVEAENEEDAERKFRVEVFALQLSTEETDK